MPLPPPARAGLTRSASKRGDTRMPSSTGPNYRRTPATASIQVRPGQIGYSRTTTCRLTGRQGALQPALVCRDDGRHLVSRNWLRWAVRTVQLKFKLRESDGQDEQLAAYLPDCDVFLTEDQRFFLVLTEITRAAPASMGIPVKISRAAESPTEEIARESSRSSHLCGRAVLLCLIKGNSGVRRLDSGASWSTRTLGWRLLWLRNAVHFERRGVSLHRRPYDLALRLWVPLGRIGDVQGVTLCEARASTWRLW